MCERCPALIAELMETAGIDEAEAVHVLWEHTAFPFNSFEETAEQAREYIARRYGEEPAST